MSERNPAHTGPAEQAAQESEQAGIADEGAAYTNAIERDAAGGSNEGGDKNGTGGTAASNPPIRTSTAGDPGVADRNATTIDLDDEAAAQRWTDRYSVTRAQLEEAVSAVGSDAHAVQTYLRGQGGGD